MLAVFTTHFLVACEKYDDSQLSGRVEGLENRVDKLEQLVADLNTNVASMTKLVKAFQEESRIERIEQIVTRLSLQTERER